jgi:ferric iron reductase protein FhuF
MPRTFIDDNFGTYDIQDEGDVEFYRDVQQRSRLKRCKGCGRKVRLLPHYAYCNDCTETLERGGDLHG